MNFKHIARFLAGTFILVSSAGLAQVPLTETVYSDWKDHIVQIQVRDREAGSKSGTGSGFIAGRDDWVVTNYHVVALLVNEPGRYQASYLAGDDERGELELLAVDIVHDLAVLRAEGYGRAPLSLQPDPPSKGTRLWSMGYPFDIGLTIVEGTFNGQLKRSLYEKLHFTGSINPGMSGGPTLDRDGTVVGVNVSTAGNQVSFLVPARHVQALLARTPGESPGEEGLTSSVARQLLDNQQSITDLILSAEMNETRLHGYTVPGDLAEFVNCWGNSEQDEENNLELVYYRCQTVDDLFLSRSTNTGIIQFQHDLVSTDSLGPMRFYRQLEKRGYYPRLWLDGDEQTVSNYRCQTRFVRTNEVPLQVTWCVRAYRQLDGLFDAFLSATSLVDEQESLQSTLVLGGFDWDNLERFAARFLETIRWTP